jgi:hypothetical protein
MPAQMTTTAINPKATPPMCAIADLSLALAGSLGAAHITERVATGRMRAGSAATFVSGQSSIRTLAH